MREYLSEQLKVVAGLLQIAVVRNNLVVSFASKLMMYKGLGSGIIRALRMQPDIIFENDRSGELFKVIIERKN